MAVDCCAFFGRAIGGNRVAAMVKDVAHLANRAKVMRAGFVPVTNDLSIKTVVNWLASSSVGNTNSWLPLCEALEKETVTLPARIASATRSLSVSNQASDCSFKKAVMSLAIYLIGFEAFAFGL